MKSSKIREREKICKIVKISQNRRECGKEARKPGKMKS